MATKRSPRYSISVSGTIYDRLRGAVPQGGIAGFIDGIVSSALADPIITARLLEKCDDERSA
jgi:hypothetical protein